MVSQQKVANRVNQAEGRIRARFETLLGFPQVLEPATVIDRREQLAGLPLSDRDADAAGIDTKLIGRQFTINVSDLIVDGTVNALNVTALEAPGDEPEEQSKAVRDALWAAWEASDLGAGSQGLFTAACCDGQAFLVCEFGADGQPAAYVNAAYDGTTGIEVKDVDADGVLRVAIKRETEQLVRDRTGPNLLQRVIDWFLTTIGRPREMDAVEFVTRKRRTLYVYDRETDQTIIRYFVKDPGQDEIEVNEADQPASGITPAVWPYGNPVIPFVSPAGGELTELESPQRLVNNAAIDLAAAGQIDALRLPYTVDCAPLAGGQQSTDDTTLSPGNSRTEPVRIQPGVFLEVRSQGSLDGMGGGGQVGVLPGSDMASHRENLKLWVELAMLIGRSSVYNLPWNAQASPPSGAALWLSMAPFRDKIESYQERWSTAFRALFEVWQRMMGLTPIGVLPVWRQMQWTTGAERLQEAVIASELGLPDTYIGSVILNLNPDELAEWIAEREAARAEQEAMLAAAAAGEEPAAVPAPA